REDEYAEDDGDTHPRPQPLRREFVGDGVLHALQGHADTRWRPRLRSFEEWRRALDEITHRRPAHSASDVVSEPRHNPHQSIDGNVVALGKRHEPRPADGIPSTARNQ